MEVIVGKTAGFCFGVKRAVEGSLNEANNSKDKIYCLGELVHNKEVIKNIEDKGITVVSDIDEIKEENVKLIIRAHGIDKKLYDTARKNKLNVIDFTCPLVSKIHEIAEEYNKKGYYIFLVGTKNHPETIGTASHCGNNYSIIENEDDIDESIKKLLNSKISNLLLIVQTTFSTKRFGIIEDTIKKELESKINIVVKNTICNATEQRQKETDELSKNVDFMIIVGGKNSSNTKKLYEIAKEYTNSILIEKADELDLEEIKKYNKIGIMAGTSTPIKIIDDVKDKIEKI